MLSLANIYTLYFRLYFRLCICLNKLSINFTGLYTTYSHLAGCILPSYMISLSQLVLTLRDQTTYEYTRGDLVKPTSLFHNVKRSFGRMYYLKIFLPVPYKPYY